MEGAIVRLRQAPKLRDGADEQMHIDAGGAGCADFRAAVAHRPRYRTLLPLPGKIAAPSLLLAEITECAALT